MPNDPYRYRDKRYYDTHQNAEATSDTVEAKNTSPVHKNGSAMSKPLMWSLAAAGGITALTLMWASKHKKPSLSEAV